jgi:leucyl aminopeptidase (aminopeptidase T)
MTPEQLEAIGWNSSTAHTDMMISNEEVNVTAVTTSGDEVPLLVNGAWVSQ